MLTLPFNSTRVSWLNLGLAASIATCMTFAVVYVGAAQPAKGRVDLGTWGYTSVGEQDGSTVVQVNAPRTAVELRDHVVTQNIVVTARRSR